MAKKSIEHNGKRIEFDEYNEIQIAQIIKDLASENTIPVIVLEVLKQTNEMMLGSVLIKLRWSVEKFQSLIDLATQNDEQYPSWNKKIQKELPLEIQAKVTVRNMPKLPQTSIEGISLDGLDELLVGAGVVVGVGAAEFKELISGAEMTFHASIQAGQLKDALQQGLSRGVKDLSIFESGSLIIINQGREKLCSIEVRTSQTSTTIKTQGLDAEKLAGQGFDLLEEAVGFGGAVAGLARSVQRGGSGLESMLGDAIEAASSTVDALSRATTTINLPAKIAGIVRGVCRGIEQEYKEQQAKEDKRVIVLQQEIQNALECIACGTSRVDGQSCTSCGYPYKGEKLTESEIENKLEEIKKLQNN